MTLARRMAHRLAVAAGVAALGGCASLDASAPQQRWAFGFVRQTVTPPDAAGSRMVAVTTFGIGLTGAGEGQGLTVGYSKNVRLTLGENACVDIKAAGPCRDSGTAATSSGKAP